MLLSTRLPLGWSQLGILLDCIFDLGFGHVLLFAKRLGPEVRCGNTTFDQEGSGALDAPLGKRLIVFHGATRVSMAFESQVGVGLDLEIPLEIVRQRNEGLLLAGQQTPVGIGDRGLSRRKVNAVQCEPGFQAHCLR